MSTTKVIHSDEDVWQLIKKLATDVHLADNLNVDFDNFPVLKIRFEGEQFHSTLPARVMESLIHLQKEIHRVYCLAAYGTYDHQLTKEEKESLEVFFKVIEGSSLINVELGDFFKKMIEKAAERMEPKHYIVITLIAAAGISSFKAYDSYLSHTTELAKEQERTKQSEEETKRLEAVIKLTRAVPEAKEALKITDNVQEKILKTVKPKESIKIQDSDKMSYETVKEITKSKRRQSAEARLDGEFTVLSISSNDSGEIRVKIVSSSLRKEYLVTLKETTEAQHLLITESLFKNKAIKFQMNGKKIADEYSDLVVVSVEPTLPKQASAD